VPQKSFAAEFDVVMNGNSFNPQNITANVGDTVFWTNADTMEHTVTADNGSFDSGSIQPGATYSISFDAPGTYRYYCKFHGGPNGTGMSGVITVGDGGVQSGNASSTGGSVYQPPAGYGTGYIPSGGYTSSNGNIYPTYNTLPASNNQFIQVPTGTVYSVAPTTYVAGQTAAPGSSNIQNYNYPGGVYRVNPYAYGNYSSYPSNNTVNYNAYPYNSGNYNGYANYNQYNPYQSNVYNPTGTATTTYPAYYPGTVFTGNRIYPYNYYSYPSAYGWNNFGGMIQPAAIPISAAQKPSAWWYPSYSTWGY
jgi:plastocyanin